MKHRNMTLFAAVEFVVIVCLCVALIDPANVPPPRDILALYKDPDLSAITWSEEKQPFADRNSQYRIREALYMRFTSDTVDLVCLGDSITQRFEWGDAIADRRVANRGIGSDTTDGMLARLDSIIRLKPKVISIMAGINDLSLKRTPDEIEASYRAILDTLAQMLPDTKVIVSSVLPVKESEPIPVGDILDINHRIKLLCDEKSIPYLDMFDAFADKNQNLKPEYAVDTVHLSPQGYALWLSYLIPALYSIDLNK